MIKLSESCCNYFTLEKRKNSRVFKKTVSYPDLHICFVAQGSADWEINNRLFTVTEGDIIFLSDMQNRRFVKYGENGLTLRVFSLDRRAFIDSYHFSFFLNCIKQQKEIFKNKDLCSVLSELHYELEEKKENYYELASLKLTEFFIKAERHMHYSPTREGKYGKKMIHVLDYIDTNLTNGISLASAASFAGFTESSFSRWFTKLNGVSFKKYVTAKKIDRAMTLLEATDLKVVDIAYECGFDSISGFYDAFRKITGTTPNKFSAQYNI